MKPRIPWFKAIAVAGVAVGTVVACRQMQAAGQGPVPKPTTLQIKLQTTPPPGAIVLYSGKEEDLRNNWYKRRTTEPADWSVGPDGAATPKHDDITSKQEFGDAYIHVEFREPMQGSGNSGVGIQGRYEVQILNSYGHQPEKHQCGAFYDEKAPIVIASKQPGEWQTYDIIFRAPRFDANGQVIEKPRATVFQNGILIQNNEEFTGPTGIQYEQYHDMAKTGPLILQGDHDPVQFRNVWVVPLEQAGQG